MEKIYSTLAQIFAHYKSRIKKVPHTKYRLKVPKKRKKKKKKFFPDPFIKEKEKRKEK